MSIKITIAACALSLPLVAHADWQYAKWGATPEQVISSSKGMAEEADPETANLHSDEDDSALVVASHQSGSYRFDVHFRFGDAKRDLQSVTLSLRDKTQCGPLSTTLTSKYGKGEEDDLGIGLVTWHDTKANNRVVYMDALLSMPCTVSYHPLRTRESEGL